MKSLPVRLQQFKTADFAAWLARHGAEVGTPTNPYEVIRYRAYHGESRKAETHIVYAKESGLLTFCGASKEHYQQFLLGAQLYPTASDNSFLVPRRDRAARVAGNPPDGWVRPDGKPFRKDQHTTASRRDKQVQRIIARDGDECWFCGRELGDDITIEHLVPKSEGGRNMLANYALAHSDCNRRAGNLPLVKKIEMRARLRGEVPA